VKLLLCAEPGHGHVGEASAAAEIGKQGLRDHDPARPVDPDPIAVKRHVHSALGPELGMRLPGDVGKQAGGEAQAGCTGIVVEHGRDPAVQQVAMLREAAEAPPRLPRSLDQRVAGAGGAVEIVVEQALADPEGGDDQLGGPELVDERRQKQVGLGKRRHPGDRQ